MEAAKDGHYADLAVDTWMNICKNHIKGILLKYGLRTLPIEAQLQSSSNHHGIAGMGGASETVYALFDTSFMMTRVNAEGLGGL
jgi:hypothetical protein